MRQKAINDLFRYWNELRGERAAPERNEIDPSAIRHLLADSFMLDIDGARHFPFRLAGTRVNALCAEEQKGASFLRLWAREERSSVADVLLTVADGACPIIAGASGAPDGHAACSFELLLLPMRHHGKTHSRILGMIKTAQSPAWLGVLPLGPLNLRTLRIVDAEGQSGWSAHAPRPLQMPHPAPPRAKGRPILRVIEGGGGRLPAPWQTLNSDVLEVEVENGHL